MDAIINETMCFSMWGACDDKKNPGICIYSGETKLMNTYHTRNIQYYKAINAKYPPLFTPLYASTFTVNGKFTNISFREDDIIDMLTIIPGSNIVKIGCNFGEIINTEPPPGSIKPIKVKSNRGRKPKIKVSTRKKQGSGLYFSSQITFEIFNPDNGKMYKMKLFRNGRFQVPGIIETSMHDLIGPVNILHSYLVEHFHDPEIRPVYLISVMRNYKCTLMDPRMLIQLTRLEEILIAEKKNEAWRTSMGHIARSLFPHTHEEIISVVGHNRGIAEIQLNSERYFGLIIKFNRTIPWKQNKKTTIKILKSGKINFDGCNSELEAHELYEWLMMIYRNNLRYIMFNVSDDVSISDSDGMSIYDDDLPSHIRDETPHMPSESVLISHTVYERAE